MRKKTMAKNDKIIHIGTRAAGKPQQAPDVNQLLERVKNPIGTDQESITIEDVMGEIADSMLVATCRLAATNQLLEAAEYMMGKLDTDWDEWQVDGDHFKKCYMSEQAWMFTESDGIMKLDCMPGIQFIRNADGEQYKLQVMLMDCDMDRLMSEEGNAKDAVSLACYCIKTNDAGQLWNFDTDSNTWIETKTDDDTETDAKMETLKVFCDQENISFNMLMTLCDLCILEDTEDILTFAKCHKMLLVLGKRLEDSMAIDIAIAKSGSVLPILIPADPEQTGMAVCVDHNDYLLCQHADSISVDEDDKSHFDIEKLSRYINPKKPQDTEDLYMKDVYRTEDPDELIRILCALTNRYTNTFRYVVPLSKDAFAVSDTAENFAKCPKIYKASGELTEKEQDLLGKASVGLMRAVACARMDELTRCGEFDEFD